MADEKYFSKHFFLGAILLLLVLTFIIVKPLIATLFAAAILAYIFNPIYKYMVKKTNRKRLAAWVIVIILIVVVVVPAYFIANALTKEGYKLFITTKQRLSNGAFEDIDCDENPGPFCNVNKKVVEFFRDPQTKFYLQDAISKFSTYIVTRTSQLVVELPRIVLYLFVMFFTVYYLLIDGAALLATTKRLVPLKPHHFDHIIREFDNFTFATLYGNLISAVIQGIVGGIIFFALGLSTPVLAGLGMAFFAFLPFIGTPIIWLPVAINLMLSGHMTKGVILVLLGIFVISMLDNLIKPEIIGKRAKLHPIGVLVGIIGGIFTLGLIGIIAGPLIISLLISLAEVYYKEGSAIA
jgi:predicted PurR-regulated permease PerM